MIEQKQFTSEVPFSEIPFSKSSRDAIVYAKRTAINFGYKTVGTKLLLLGLIRQGDINGVFKIFDTTAKEKSKEIEFELIQQFEYRKAPITEVFSGEVEGIFQRALAEANKDRSEVSPSHLCIALAESKASTDDSEASFRYLDEIREFFKKNRK